MPATTVPVTIIGAFAAMAAMGFTVNISTLFAIILAIGIVVDDAIVIVEGVARHIEEGMAGQPAAEKAMDELFGPVVGITLVLMSVFLPAAFLPGLTGQMFKQFALVIAATAFISAINAATLSSRPVPLWLRKRCRRRSATSSIAGSTRSMTPASTNIPGLSAPWCTIPVPWWWWRWCSSASPATPHPPAHIVPAHRGPGLCDDRGAIA